MWKQFKLTKNFSSILLLAVALSILTSLYYVFSMPKLPVFSATLLICGAGLALLVSFNNLFPFYVSCLLLALIFSTYSFSPLPAKVFSNLTFFIQWFFFWWALEIGQKLKRVKKSSNKIFSSLALSVCLAAFFYLTENNYKAAILLSAAFSFPAYFFKNKNSKINFLENIIPLLLFFVAQFLYFPLIYSLKIFFLFIFLFLSFEIYEFFLKEKVKPFTYLLFISFFLALISYTIFPIPIFICGLFLGKLFANKPFNFMKSKEAVFIKFFFTAILLSQINLSIKLLPLVPVAVLIFIFEIVLIKNSKSKFLLPQIEFALAFISIPFYWNSFGSKIIFILWIVLLLNAVLEIVKPKRFHSPLKEKVIQDK